MRLSTSHFCTPKNVLPSDVILTSSGRSTINTQRHSYFVSILFLHEDSSNYILQTQSFPMLVSLKMIISTQRTYSPEWFLMTFQSNGYLPTNTLSKAALSIKKQYHHHTLQLKVCFIEAI